MRDGGTPRSVHRRLGPRGYAGGVTLEIIDDWFGPSAIDFVDAWDLQRDLHARRVADQVGDTALFLEHPPVYTAGRRTEQFERPFLGLQIDPGGLDGLDAVEMQRGALALPLLATLFPGIAVHEQGKALVGLGIAHIDDADDGVLRGGRDHFEVFGVKREQLEIGH